jgi:hypothetical protein
MTAPEAAELEAVDAALAGRAVPPEHAELAELALLLRDEKPEPRGAWGLSLDRRVQAGFPAAPRRPSRLRAWFTPGAAVTAVACTVIAVLIGLATLSPLGSDDDGSTITPRSDVGIEGSGGDSDESGGAAGGGGESAAAESAGGSEEQSRASSDSAIAPVPPPTPRTGDPGSDSRDRRQVERSAALTLAARPREIDQVASDVGRVAADLGGFVSQSSISSSNGGSIDLRVPSERLDSAIQRLSRLATVRELTRESRDITSSVVSARERLNDARTERKSLLRQLAAATTINETESLRARLRIVSREIAAARSRLRSVNNRAQFANVGVTLVTDRSRDDDEGAWTPGDALDDAGRVLEVIAGVTLIALAVALPLLLAGGLGWIARRGLTRRRRERALDIA